MSNTHEKYQNIRKVTPLRIRAKIQEEALARILKPAIKKEVIFEEHSYCGEMDSYHLCDFIYEDKKTKKPLIVYIHGGGWVCGSKDLRRGQLSTFASKGFFVLSVNYTLCPEAKFPKQFVDIYSAVDFCLDKSEEYNIDKNNIFFMGDSAGGHLCTLLSAYNNNPKLKEKLNIKTKHSFKVQGVAPLCGLFNLREVLKCRFPSMKKYLRAYAGGKLKTFLKSEDSYMQSPINFVEDLPPTFIVMAEKDRLKSESEELLRKMCEKGKEVRLFVGRGIIAFHVFTVAFNFENSKKCLSDIANFFLLKCK